MPRTCALARTTPSVARMLFLWSRWCNLAIWMPSDVLWAPGALSQLLPGAGELPLQVLRAGPELLHLSPVWTNHRSVVHTGLRPLPGAPGPEVSVGKTIPSKQEHYNQKRDHWSR